ncbi:hypothetical protein VNO77_21826 [Canavalia gladiata]|uniref:Uncharacterized protein n=1 Tax=Canavalia gladiata TaxID=3824 RepID=A0AAN9L2C5_CANGL
MLVTTLLALANWWPLLLCYGSLEIRLLCPGRCVLAFVDMTPGIWTSLACFRVDQSDCIGQSLPSRSFLICKCKTDFIIDPWFTNSKALKLSRLSSPLVIAPPTFLLLLNFPIHCHISISNATVVPTVDMANSIYMYENVDLYHLTFQCLDTYKEESLALALKMSQDHFIYGPLKSMIG